LAQGPGCSGYPFIVGLIEDQLVALTASQAAGHALIDAAGIAVVSDHRIEEWRRARVPTIFAAPSSFAACNMAGLNSM